MASVALPHSLNKASPMNPPTQKPCSKGMISAVSYLYMNGATVAVFGWLYCCWG